MAEFAVKVMEITNPIEDHPNADRLSIIRIHDYLCISAKLEDGSHRYSVGDLIVYVPEGAVVPEYLLKPGFWNENTGKGILAGANGDRVKAMKLRGIISQGILFPVETEYPDGLPYGRGFIRNAAGEEMFVNVDDDVSEFLGITKYEPPIPSHMAGEVANVFGNTTNFDVNSLQGCPDLFDGLETEPVNVPEDGDPSKWNYVVATEKLHGTNCQIVYVPGLNHPEMHAGGEVLVGSKTMMAKGLAFKNNEANDYNIYVRQARKMVAAGLVDRIKAFFGNDPGLKNVCIIGEIFGFGVQDLQYGLKGHEFRIFEVKVNGEYLDVPSMIRFANGIDAKTVPMVYEGPFNRDALIAVRDGKDMINGANIREGIVIRTYYERPHVFHGRRMAKWVSPDYLLRRSKDATEYS